MIIYPYHVCRGDDSTGTLCCRYYPYRPRGTYRLGFEIGGSAEGCELRRHIRLDIEDVLGGWELRTNHVVRRKDNLHAFLSRRSVDE